MDPLTNPFAPGSGTPPPFLAGQDRLLADSDAAFARLRVGKLAQVPLLCSERGTGKTVILARLQRTATSYGFLAIDLDPSTGANFLVQLVARLRQILISLDQGSVPDACLKRAARLLTAFVDCYSAKGGMPSELRLAAEPLAGTIDSGNLEHDLAGLIFETAQAVQSRGHALGLFIDNLHLLDTDQINAVFAGVHRALRESTPICCCAAGLPQFLPRIAAESAWLDDLFGCPDLSCLPPDAAQQALEDPFVAAGGRLPEEAMDLIYSATKGIPLLVQEFGYALWNSAADTTPTLDEIKIAGQAMTERVDANFYGSRWGRLSAREQGYLRALAAADPVPQRSSEVAKRLGMSMSAVAPLRSTLMAKFLVHSPRYGETDFTIPFFGDFIARLDAKAQARKDDPACVVPTSQPKRDLTWQIPWEKPSRRIMKMRVGDIRQF